MYRWGFFRSLSNQLYKVVVITNWRSKEIKQGEELQLLSSPFSIEMQSDESTIYKPYKCSTATVRFSQKVYDSSFNNSLGNNVLVKLLKEKPRRSNKKEDYESDKQNYITEWVGFAVPNSYNQSYSNETDDFELECQDALSTLQYVRYKRNFAQHNSIQHYLFSAIQQLEVFTDIYWPDSTKAIKTNVDDSSLGSFKKECSILEEVYIKELNWFDEDGVPKNQLEIIEQICQYLGLSCIPYKEAIYFIDYDQNRDTNLYQWYKLSNWMKQGGVLDATKPHYILKDQVSSNDCQLSVLGQYNKVSVTAKHYPISKAKNQKFEEMNLEPAKAYGVKGQYGASMQNISDGEDSLHVQHFKVGNKQIGNYNLFIRYNHFNKDDDFLFYSYKLDKDKKQSDEYKVNDDVLSKDTFYQYNVCTPCEFDSQETKDQNAEVRSVSLKKAFIYYTAFGNFPNNVEMFRADHAQKDWKQEEEKNKQVIFEHTIVKNFSTNRDNEQYVNVNFNYKAYWGAFAPCKELRKNNYLSLQYRLKFGDKYYNSKLNDWSEEPYTCTMSIDESGNIINELQTWKDQIKYGSNKGLLVSLPGFTTGSVVFELLRPYTGMNTTTKVGILPEAPLFESKWKEYTRYTQACNVFTEYEATLVNKGEFDDSETEYQNALDDNDFVEEMDKVENEVTTYDGKAPNYSSTYIFHESHGFVEYLQTIKIPALMAEATPEEYLVARLSNQYKNPQLKLEISLNAEIPPYKKVIYSWFADKEFIVDSYSFEVAEDQYNYSFIEKKPLDGITEVLTYSKVRNKKKNGDNIYHDESYQPKRYRTAIEYDYTLPSFRLTRSGTITMSIK